MATFAELNANNDVVGSALVADEVLLDSNNTPQESLGVDFCKSMYPTAINFVQSFTDGKRRRSAVLGDHYDANTDAFYRPVRTENPINPAYINLPNGNSYCIIFRNASSLITSLIKKVYYPDNSPVGQSVNNIRNIPQTAVPTGIPHAIIRDPVDRFASSYGLQTGGVPNWLSVDDFLTWISQQDPTKINKHFRKQTLLVGNPVPNGIIYHDFKKDLNSLAATLGLPTPLGRVNETAKHKKPTLTDAQIAKIQELYPEDVALYSQVSSQPAIVTPTPAPATDSTTTDATANPVDNSANPDTTTTP